MVLYKQQERQQQFGRIEEDGLNIDIFAKCGP
jgi:hypothetical protein